ncbi:USE1 protein, partial [Amia calva]|nr:USE1 protein [Amia calva]
MANCDHNMVSFEAFFQKTRSKSKTMVYNFRNANLEGMRWHLEEVDWSTLHTEPVENGWVYFKNILFEAQEQFVPKLSKLRTKKHWPKWFNSNEDDNVYHTLLFSVCSKPAPEVLTDYCRKVDFLKGLLEAEKLTSPTEKALANQLLAPGRNPTTANERTPASKTVHMQTKARCTGEMRNELLGEVRHYPRALQGVPLDEKQSAAELDAVLQHHHNLQEKLAEEMLSLARSLKNNTLAAQNMIKQDNQTLTQSMRMADLNFEKLKTESERLEQHTKKSVNWFLWLMLIVVCFTFISMILFIRIFPKLR